MRPRSILALAVAFFLVFGPAGAALAKSSGGGSRSSSSSSRSSSSSSSGWSSSSKPSTPTPSTPSGSTSSSSGWSSSSKPAQPGQSTQPSATAPAQTSSTPGGWSNTGGASSAPSAKSSGTSAFSSAGSDAVKKQAATSSYQGYQGLYSKSGNAVPGQVSTGKPILNQNRSFGSYQEYNGYRDNYYAGRGWSAPGYAFNSFSSFGMWDAMFMWFMLSNLTSGASFFHNNHNDPGVQAFRQEAQKLSESNADLKKQVAELNAKLDQMNKDGVPVDPNAVPKDVDPNVMLAQPKIVEAKAQDSKNSSGSLFWPIVTLVAVGGIGYLIFSRRKTA
ncbi:MAG: hypothetical protein HY915_19060 [Desulfovibrio sp.]|nr:hypothetical protein [Desulfovibrio sp.]